MVSTKYLYLSAGLMVKMATYFYVLTTGEIFEDTFDDLNIVQICSS